MATVPTVTGQSVNVRPLSPTYQSSELSSAFFNRGFTQAAQGIEKFGNKVGDVVLNAMNEDNERAAKDLEVKFREELSRLQYGDGTQNNQGYFGTEGQAALDSYNPTLQAINRARQQLLDAAPNDAVKNAFGQSSAYLQTSAVGEMSRFAGQQREVANDKTSAARMASVDNDAANNYLDDSKINDAIKVKKHETDSIASRKGWSKEVGQEEFLNNTTATLTSVIKAAITDHPERAQEVYDKYSQYIAGSAKPGLRQILDQQLLLKQSQDAASGIMAMGLSYEDSIAKAREITNPKLQKEAVEEVKVRLAEREHASDRAYTLANRADEIENRNVVGEAQKQADNIIDSFGGQATLEEYMSAVRDQEFSPKVRAAVEARIKSYVGVQDYMDTQQEKLKAKTEHEVDRQYTLKLRQEKEQKDAATKSLNDFVNSGGSVVEWQRQNPEANALLSQEQNALPNAERREKAIAEGKLYADVSDGHTLNDLRKLDPSALAQIDPTQYQGTLTQTEYNSLGNYVVAARRSIANAQGNSNVYYNQGAQLLKTYAPTNLNVGKAKQTQEQKDKFNDALNEMNAWVDSFTSQGKTPDASEMRKKAQSLMLPVTADPTNTGWLRFPRTGETFFDGLAAEAAKMSAQQRATARVDISAIPQNILNEIQQAIQLAGKDPSDEDLVENIAGAKVTGNQLREKQLLGNK